MTSMRPNCFVWLLLKLASLVLLFSFLTTPPALANDRMVRVGLQEVKPSVFTDESGKPAGVFIDLLEHIAKSEGWQLRYVPGTWAEGLERLEKGEIDLVVNINFTAERATRFSYSKVPVLITWSTVYARKGSGIVSILDLKGKKVALGKGMIHTEGFLRMNQGFSLEASLFFLPDYDATFAMVARGEADATVCNSMAGSYYRKQYGLDKTAIMFNPVDAHYAATKGDPKQLLESIDRHIAAMKGDPLSIYASSLKRWQLEEDEFIIPTWLWILGFVILSGLLLSLLGAAILRKQVAARTREFRESEEKYRSLVENLNVGIARITVDGRFLQANPAMLRMFGYGLEELSRIAVQETYQDPMDRVAYLQEMRQHGHVRNRELRLRQKDGTPIWVSITADAQFDEQGEIKWMDTFAEDITEIKKATDALRESERRLADIIEFLPVATFVINREGRVVTWNKAIEKMTGVRAEEMIGKGDYEYAFPFYGERRPILIDLALLSQEEQEEWLRNKYVSATRDGDLVAAEATASQVKGEVRILSGWAHPLYNSEGQIIGAIENISDITDKRQAEELRFAKNVAETANRAKSIFLANMSHEIRTPLNAILGFSQILGNDHSLSPQHREYVNTINRSGEYLLNLINDILEISKIEAGRVVLNLTDFDLRAMIKELELMFRNKAEAKQLTLAIVVASDVPCCVRGDEGKLRQIFVNLLGNAVKFTQKGAISLRVSCRQGQDGGVRLVSEIRDTGVGIAPTEQSRLFKYFEQTTSGLRSGGGTGLGLAISKQYVTMMGGDITVESEVGQGSLFHFEVELQAGDTKGIDSKRKLKVTGIRSGGERHRVLIVDDKQENRQVLTRMLQKVGFMTAEAGDGVNALEKFVEWQPHLVLMDMRMPVMDGYEATRRIRGLEGGTKVPIVAVTASALDDDRQEVMAAGVDGFIGKPFREHELFHAIGSALDIDYMYAEEAAEETLTPETLSGLAPEAIAALPPDIVTGLRRALSAADFDAMLELIARIEIQDQITAAILRGMARRYEYEALLHALSQGE